MQNATFCLNLSIELGANIFIKPSSDDIPYKMGNSLNKSFTDDTPYIIAYLVGDIINIFLVKKLVLAPIFTFEKLFIENFDYIKQYINESLIQTLFTTLLAKSPQYKIPREFKNIFNNILSREQINLALIKLR